jgi:sugar phosphate isomerase/epimerase
MTRTIGLQLYTLRDHLTDRAAILERVAGLGVQSVEPYGFARPELTRAERLAEARALKEDVESAGLTISSVHTAMPGPDDAGWFFEALAEAAVPIAIAPVPEALAGFARDAFEDAETVARYGERLSALAEVAERSGARVGYHNHWWEWPAYDALWEHCDPRVLAEVDLYWAQAAGQVPAEVVSKLGARVELVHVKDGPATLEFPPQQTTPGTGAVALADALAAGASITTCVIEADDLAPGADVFDFIAGAVEWLLR